MQPYQNNIQCRWLSVASSAALAIIVAVTACTHQHHATLFPDGKKWLGWSAFERGYQAVRHMLKFK